MATTIFTDLKDLSTGSVLATGNSTSAILIALQNLVSAIGSGTSYTASFYYSTTSTFNMTNLVFTVNDYECPIDNLALHIYATGVDAKDYGTFPIPLIQEGNCSTRNCFTTNELKTIYQQALNMCGICNCT